jgi:hypothetical protein
MSFFCSLGALHEVTINARATNGKPIFFIYFLFLDYLIFFFVLAGNIEIKSCFKADKSRKILQDMISMELKANIKVQHIGMRSRITYQIVVIYNSFFFPSPEILFTFAGH